MRLASVIHAKCNKKQKGFPCNVLYVFLGTLTSLLRPFEKLVLLLIRLLAELNYICERPFVPDAVMVISPSTPLRSSSRTWNYELRKLLLPLSRAYSISDPASRNRQTAKSIAINQLTIARLTISHL